MATGVKSSGWTNLAKAAGKGLKVGGATALLGGAISLGTDIATGEFKKIKVVLLAGQLVLQQVLCWVVYLVDLLEPLSVDGSVVSLQRVFKRHRKKIGQKYEVKLLLI